MPHVCEVIYKTLKKDYLSLPLCEEDWLTLVENTNARWQFPNAWGAVDGKHVHLLHPPNSGSEFYNYKGFHSIVLMAIVGYDYKFLYVNVGCQGSISGRGVFKNTDLHLALETKQLGLPDPKPLPYCIDCSNIDPVPFILVGDEAFPLSKYLMKPYAQRNLDDERRIYNYRMSVTENAFGILVNRFRLWVGRCNLSPDKASILLLASLVLHNMSCTKSKKILIYHLASLTPSLIVAKFWKD